MKNISAAVLAVSLFAGPAAASTGPSGYITDIHSIGSGLILFTQGGSRDAMPGCAVAPSRWAFDASTAAGQSKLATLLTAYALHKPVAVIGTATCNVWGDTESVSYLASLG